ncbi:MAG: hypothetical protein ACE5GJ_06880, partial [Gemmatimonadota bacterium]
IINPMSARELTSSTAGGFGRHDFTGTDGGILSRLELYFQGDLVAYDIDSDNYSATFWSWFNAANGYCSTVEDIEQGVVPGGAQSRA